MAQFLRDFDEALNSSDSITFLHEARQAFTGTDDDARERALYLQSDEQFLEKLLMKFCSNDCTIARANAILELIFCALFSSLPITVSFVKQWSQLVLKKLPAASPSQYGVDVEEHRTKHTLVVMVTLEIIESAKSVPLSTQTLTSDFFVSSPEILATLHDTIMALIESQSHCSPITIAWGIYLHKILEHLAQDDCSVEYQTFLDHVFANSSKEPHRQLIESAITGGLYSQLVSVIDRLPSHNDERYKSVLLILFGEIQRYINLSHNTSRLFARLVTSRALANLCWETPQLMHMVDNARQQFPHEYPTFVQLLRCLANSGASAINYLNHLPTFTQVLPTGFQNYQVVSEESGQTLIELTEPLKVFAGRPGTSGITIVPETRGLMIAEPRGPLILWQHQYSGIQYMFHVLQSSASRLTINDHSESVQETIDIFTNLIYNCDDIEEVLKSMQGNPSEALPSTVLQIYEQAIYENGSLSILTTCLKFFETLLAISPVLAWPLVSRIGFSERVGTNDILGNFTAALEESSQAFAFVSAYCSLTSMAMSDLVKHALTLGERLLRLKTNFLLHSVQYLLKCYKSYSSWRIGVSGERQSLGIVLSQFFEGILRVCYQTHLLDSEPTRHIAQVLSPASNLILQELGSQSMSKTAQNNNFEAACEHLISTEFVSNDRDLVKAVFELYQALLSVPQSLGRANEQSHNVCFSKIPTLLSTWSTRPQAKHIVVTMITSIVQHTRTSVPPLLALLGDDTEVFKNNLFDCFLENTAISESESAGAWRLLACFLTPEQEGLALFLLGTRGSGKDSLLQLIAKHILQLSTSDHVCEPTMSILAVLAASQAWADLVHEQLSDQSPFWAKMRELFLVYNASLSNQSDTAITVQDSTRLVCASLISQILATEFTCLDNQMRSGKDWNFTTLFEALPEDALVVTHYRASLHGNLSRNLSQKYSGFALAALKKHKFSVNDYGETFCYDMQLAQKLIQPNSFLRELRTANLNLSLMDAQGFRIRGLYVVLSTSVLQKIESEAKWRSIRSVVHKLLQQDIEVPILQGLSSEALRTASVLIHSLCNSSVEANVHDYLGLLGDLTRRSEILKVNENVQSSSIISQLICTVLASISKLTLSRNELLPLQRHLSMVFGQVVCSQAMHCAETLRRAKTDKVIDCANTVIVMGRLIAGLLESHNLPKAGFALELSRTNAFEALTALFADMSDLNEQTRNSYAYTIVQMLLMLFDVTNAANQLMHAGVFRLLLDSQVARQIQSAPTTESESSTKLWVSGFLPLMLCLVSSLGVRVKDEMEILINAYSSRIEHNFSSWTQSSAINNLMTRELVLIVMLNGSYDSMLEEPDQDYVSARDDLAGRLDYMLAHPKTTMALNVDKDHETEILENLEAALDILRPVQAV